jgi:hypothetical protein
MQATSDNEELIKEIEKLLKRIKIAGLFVQSH